MKIKNILLSVVCCAALVACNEKEFLDLPPQASLDNASLTTSEGISYLINAAYAALAGPNVTFGAMSSPVNHWIEGELHSDNAYKGGGGPSDNTNMHMIETNAIDASHGLLNGWWQALYQSIRRTNMALNALDDLDPADVPELEYLKAEMRVLRAHYYFELSRHFNKIAWIDDKTPEDEYSTTRNDVYSRDEILGMIAKDMEEAGQILPDSFQDLGRINKWVAKAYAAKVYLYKAYRQNPSNNAVTGIDQADLQKVVSLTGEVINSGKYGLFDDFQQLDIVEYENGKESIFAVQYSMNDGATLSLPWAYSAIGHVNWSALLNTPKGPYNGDNFFWASQDLVNAFKTVNGLPMLDGSFQNEDYDVVVETVNGDTKTYTNTQIDHPVDPRLDFIVGRLNVRWKTYEVEPVTETWYRDFNSYGYHIIKRFLVSPDSGHLATTYPWGNSGLNYQIIRYASVLLWRAEAMVELGQLDEARELVNQIRRRAKNSPYVTAWADKTRFPQAVDIDGYAAKYEIEEYPAAGWTQDYARKAVRFETRLELALEGERFFDLVRWGVMADTMNRFVEVEKGKRVYYEGVSFKAGRDEYFPIPVTQYNLTGGTYVQNPGYAAFN
ncbi:MAG: RagB/SusD family nutrient uptake outer membrane protein [Bacteroidales bacterium]|nr:RagB/SusD family nutrient uptake outer membrane protein [Bacteroidales bacterium]